MKPLELELEEVLELEVELELAPELELLDVLELEVELVEELEDPPPPQPPLAAMPTAAMPARKARSGRDLNNSDTDILISRRMSGSLSHPAGAHRRKEITSPGRNCREKSDKAGMGGQQK